jgi:hypothetical protein
VALASEALARVALASESASGGLPWQFALAESLTVASQRHPGGNFRHEMGIEGIWRQSAGQCLLTVSPSSSFL